MSSCQEMAARKEDVLNTDDEGEEGRLLRVRTRKTRFGTVTHHSVRGCSRCLKARGQKDQHNRNRHGRGGADDIDGCHFLSETDGRRKA